MELIDNITKTLRDDLAVEIKEASKVSMAACCFSIYAFQELKEQLKNIKEFRFIFTSPTFTAEKIAKQRREFYIPRIDRERTLYGSPFEVRLRNQLSQKAIATECAEWVRKKVRFKSNTTDNTIPGFINIESDDPHTYTPVNGFTTTDLGCERGNSMMNFINKVVWVIHIPKHLPRRPVYAHKKAWQRIKDNLVTLTYEREEAILSEGLLKQDWTAQILPDATIDDLDPVAILKAREKYKEVHPGRDKEVDGWDDRTFLNKAHITIKDKITIAAIILVGREESEHYLLPKVCKVRWTLKNEQTENLDFKVFSIPMILAIEEIGHQIRNTSYEFTISGNIFPEKLFRYDEFTLREPLNNAIAHQDYDKGARIEVIEYENDHLVFRNYGAFLPESVEKVVLDNSPESIYRNPFLVEAMRNVHMVDTEGGGIKKLFEQQKKRFFPMPEYDTTCGMVTVDIEGKVINEQFARILVSVPDLSMSDLILLDKVQKQKRLDDEEIKYLRKKKYVEGRKNGLFLSKVVTKNTGNVGLKSTYVKNKSFDDEYFRRLIVQYIEKFGAASRSEIDELLMSKLSDVLSEQQKQNKITNLLSYLRIHNVIMVNEAKKWVLVK